MKKEKIEERRIQVETGVKKREGKSDWEVEKHPHRHWSQEKLWVFINACKEQ